MSITVGQHLPNLPMHIAKKPGPKSITTDALFANKKSILFGLPGAFTPVCSGQQVPSYIQHKAALKAAGVDQIICVSINDGFVMQAWAENLNTQDNIIMLCDGSGAFTKAIGMEIDLSAHGMGTRSNRYTMIVDNGVVTHLEVEESAAQCKVSHAEAILDYLKKYLI